MVRGSGGGGGGGVLFEGQFFINAPEGIIWVFIGIA